MARNPAIGWLLLAALVLGTFAWLMWAGLDEEAGGSPRGVPAGRTPSDGG
jgi:hypothetical protein